MRLVKEYHSYRTLAFLRKIATIIYTSYHLQLPPYHLAIITLPPGSLLVTFNVSSLYTNIPHQEGLTACEKALYQRNIQKPPTADLCHLMRLVLTRNTFTFNGEFFLQQHGTAMKARMASRYANMFVGKLEREFLQTRDLQPLV